nr:ferric reductase-like transmembrane domain-containing protein [Tsuneonella aeria]
MAWRLASGEATAFDLYQPTGELSLRLMLLALIPGPLAEFFGRGRFLRAWLSVRRNLGVAAFVYAALHLAAYVADMQALAAMLAELALPGIWTGWLAFAVLAVPASISTDVAMRRLGRTWKRLQWLAYPALALALLHWALLDRAWLPVLVHLVPLGLAWSLRIAARNGYRFRRRPA